MIFPDIPYAATDGSTLDEALDEAIACPDEAIAGYIYHNEPIPEPSRIKREQYAISLHDSFNMYRPFRTEYENAFYYVMIREINGVSINRFLYE